MPARTPLVLVVDDHADNCAMLALALTYSGFEVVTAGTAEEALVLVQALALDAVVTDVRLPGCSGLELSLRLREAEPTSHLAILLLSGDARAGQHARECGSDQFLLKPVPPDALAAAITAAMAARAVPPPHATAAQAVA